MDLRSKRVLITGGAGFLGRHLTRGLIERGCRHIKILSRDEHKHEVFRKELSPADGTLVRFIIGDVCNTGLLKYAVRDVDCVIHAAALKIIPAMQYNPLSAIEVNMNGWLSVVRAVLDNNRPVRVVGISTDKAVEPLNTYGKAKALGEDLFIHANVYSREMVFSCVRFGNVVGSTSSLVEQCHGSLEAPTLTHIDMTRFFISPSKAVETTLYALDKAFGGEIFVYPCQAARIKDLLRTLTKRTDLHITGLRRGEKLHETLVSRYEAQRTVQMDGYYIILPEEFASEGDPYSKLPLARLGKEYSSNSLSLQMAYEELKEVLGI